MFQGSPHISLDSKGRFSVPRRFCSVLKEVCSGQVTFTRHPDGCALLYPRNGWAEKKEELKRLPYSLRSFQRIVLGSAVDVDMDAAGRLLIPQELRQSCSLSKDIVLVGLGDHFELWDAELLARSEEEAKAQDITGFTGNFNF